MTGKLLFIDGPDGAGKTTATSMIVRMIKERKDEIGDVELVNILSSHPTSMEIRKILTSTDSVLSQSAELLLYAAAIKNSMEMLVDPLLRSGKNVLVDRGPLSNFCYQVMSKSNPAFDLWKLIHKTTRADGTLLLSVDPEVGLQRCMDRDGSLDRIESRGEVFQRCVISSFKMINEEISASEDSIFKDISGKTFYYENNSSLEKLRECCQIFVSNMFTTSPQH